MKHIAHLKTKSCNPALLKYIFIVRVLGLGFGVDPREKEPARDPTNIPRP